MLSLQEIAAVVKMGGNIEDAIPEGADPEYWKLLLRNYEARQDKPKSRRQTSRNRRSGRPGKRTNYANRVIALATTEALDRVNGGAE